MSTKAQIKIEGADTVFGILQYAEPYVVFPYLREIIEDARELESCGITDGRTEALLFATKKHIGNGMVDIGAVDFPNYTYKLNFHGVVIIPHGDDVEYENILHELNKEFAAEGTVEDGKIIIDIP